MGVKNTFLSFSAFSVLGVMSATAFASGTVQQLSGAVSVQKTDGTVRALSRASEVGRGDTLNTERDSYAQVKFADGAVMTLKPNTRLKIDDFVYDTNQPNRDNASFALLKGGLRMLTGLVGKRGNQDALRLNTATATIGIRGTTFTVEDCVTTICSRRGATRVGTLGSADYASLDSASDWQFPDASVEPEKFNAWVNLDRVLSKTPRDPFALMGERVAQTNAACGSASQGGRDDCLAPAVYVGVSDGEIVVQNSAGQQSFRAGQFGAIQNFNSRPQTLPGDPGLPIYQPPATFFQNISGAGARAGGTQCIVN